MEDGGSITGWDRAAVDSGRAGRNVAGVMFVVVESWKLGIFCWLLIVLSLFNHGSVDLRSVEFNELCGLLTGYFGASPFVS